MGSLPVRKFWRKARDLDTMSRKRKDPSAVVPGSLHQEWRCIARYQVELKETTPRWMASARGYVSPDWRCAVMGCPGDLSLPDCVKGVTQVYIAHERAAFAAVSVG